MQQNQSQSNQINSNNLSINHQQAVDQPKPTFVLHRNQHTLSNQFETNLQIDSAEQCNQPDVLNQSMETQEQNKDRSHNDEINIFQQTNTIQNNNPQINGDTHSNQTIDVHIEQPIGSEHAKQSSHQSNQKSEPNIYQNKQFEQDHKSLTSEVQDNSYLSDLDNQLLSSQKDDENNFSKGQNKTDQQQVIDKSLSQGQYQNQIEDGHPKFSRPNMTVQQNEITIQNKDNDVIIEKQQSEQIDQMNSSRGNFNDLDDQSTFQKDKYQRTSIKKRTRKRLEKRGSESNDQIDYVSNLQRAKTKIFEEDKVNSDLKIDATAFRTNSLQIQKFQSVATMSGPSFTKGKVNQQQKMGRWTKDEHFRFLVALKLYGKEWRKVQEHVLTRTSTQARSHAQKFFQKLEKRNQNLEEFLLALDVNNLEKHCIMSDLEDENSPRGPQVKGKNNKSKQKYGARNSTLVIPDVVIPPKQPITEQEQKDENHEQVNSYQSSKSDKNRDIKIECEIALNQNAERIQEISKDNRSSNSVKLDKNEQNSKKQSSSSQQREKEDDLSNQKNLDENINNCSQSNQQSIQSPKKTKDNTNENNKISLLTKRINPQQQTSEFQLPLPKKTYNQLKSPQNDPFSSEQRKRSGSQKNLVTIVQGDSLQKKQMYISIKQQHMSPHLPKQNANKLELMNKNQQLAQNESNMISRRQITTINQPIIQPVISGIYNLGPQNSGNQSAPPIVRPHSNSLSGTTQPHSTLLAQKLNSAVVPGNGLQQNSQFSAMTGANNNMTAQFPMTPNLRHSATSVMNCPVGYSILDLEAQHYSVISQMSNANYQQQKYGKEKARANSFDEGFFKNILDKDHEESDNIDENVILPHIQAALVNKIKELPIQIVQGMPIDHKNNYYNDAMKNDGMNSHNRINMTPKTKYHTTFNMSHSAAQQQILGFDDGLQRMRSNMRRDDSNEPLLTQEDHEGQVEIDTSKENQHLIGQQDFNQQIQQQAVIQAAIQGYQNTNQGYNLNPQQFNYSMYDQGINQIIQQRNQNQGLSQLLSLQNSNLQIDPNMLQNSNVRGREQQQYLIDQQLQSSWKQQETLKALQKQQQAHQVAALQYQQSINHLQEQRPIFNLDQQPNRQQYQVSDQNMNQQQSDQRQQMSQREEFWKQKMNQQQAQAQYVSDQQQLLTQIQKQNMHLTNRQLKATDGQQ